MLKIDLSGVEPFLEKQEWQKKEAVGKAFQTLIETQGAQSEFTTFLNLPETYNRKEFERFKSVAAKIQGESDVLLVIGVGGSYLGAKAAIDLLRTPNYNLVTKSTPNIYFVGNNLSAEHINEIGYLLRDKNFSINVISKSGETLESAIAFRIFKELLVNRYGDVGARGRIYATCDRYQGALRQMTEKEGYERFTIPNKIGGRYSLLTAVGLLPMAVAGIDIDRVMAGAFEGMKTFTEEKSFKNPAWQYAAVRQALAKQGKEIEVLSCYEPAFRYMAEWWKQLYGESEGKGGGGIFPVSVELTADLHSLGQYLQEGRRNLMQTVVSFDKFRREITVPQDKEDLDKLNYLAGRELSEINAIARRASIQAHVEGGLPTMEIKLGDMSETSFGTLSYFFQIACGISAYMQGVNPFDQPGVEAYKRNMFQLLGKS